MVVVRASPLRAATHAPAPRDGPIPPTTGRPPGERGRRRGFARRGALPHPDPLPRLVEPPAAFSRSADVALAIRGRGKFSCLQPLERARNGKMIRADEDGLGDVARRSGIARGERLPAKRICYPREAGSLSACDALSAREPV